MLAWIILSWVGGCPVHRRVLGFPSSLCPLEAGGPLHTPQRTLYVCACEVTAVISDFLQRSWLQPAWLLCPWDSPGKHTGVGCHALLQGIFLTQGSNPCLMSPALAGMFFTTSTIWEGPVPWAKEVSRCGQISQEGKFLLVGKHFYRA